MCESVCIKALSREIPLWYSEVLLQLPISILGRIPEEIYMSSKHLYGAIVVYKPCVGMQLRLIAAQICSESWK